MSAASDTQSELFPPPTQTDDPEGLGYWPDVISAEWEADLAERLGALPLEAYDHYGHLANRRVAYFGHRYNAAVGEVGHAGDAPAYLLELRDQIAEIVGEDAAAFSQVLINEYRLGAGIGWHRDRPQFGRVLGVSLLTPAVMRFRRQTGPSSWERRNVPLAPRSVYRLAGPARGVWQHSITPGEALRYSVTFRTLA